MGLAESVICFPFPPDNYNFPPGQASSRSLHRDTVEVIKPRNVKSDFKCKMSSIPPGFCFVCRTLLDEGPVVVVKKRGIKTLKDVSVKRGLPENEEFLKRLNEVSVHDVCRKRYVAEKNVAASERRGGDASLPPPAPSISRRSSSSSESTPRSHILADICFLCGEKITEQFLKAQQKLNISRRNKVHKVELMSFKDSVIKVAECCGVWGQQIIDRLSCISDLVAAEARYHNFCLKKLYGTQRKTGNKRGRSACVSLFEGMERIYQYLTDNRDECQFSINELIQQNFKGDYTPALDTVENHLSLRYGEKVTFTRFGGGNRPVIMRFRDVGERILYEEWYSERKKNDPTEEKLRIIKTAAKLVLEDMRSKIFDNTYYPPSHDFMEDAESCIPESLNVFLETVVLTNKRTNLDKWKKKCVAFGHAIMSAVRPKSFLSSVQISFGSYLYRKFGSRHLINLCYAMGFSCSYSEAMRVEGSAIVSGETSQQIEKRAFMQFVWDNADVNVSTLDGLNTFHEMGGIMIITPESAVLPDKRIPRLKQISAGEISSQDNSLLKQFTMKKNAGLSAISISELEITGNIAPTDEDLLWLYGKSTGIPGIPGWNGYMEQVTQNLPYRCSKIVYLPFIHAPPTDYDTVLTTLLESSERTSAHGQKTCFVTYDQPLYMKARDIVESCQYSQLSTIVVRLGGFHLLMSFMGAVGSIMAGSGLKELFATIFAENSVDKILNGHAYSRAVRGHMLINLALATLIVKGRLQLTEEECLHLEVLLNETGRCELQHAAADETVQMLGAMFRSALEELEKQSPTSKLWVQYLKMTTLIKKFIQAERTGDWILHLETIKNMLPFFHSAGHFNYAKSARLYLQDMSTLEQKMEPIEFREFTQEGGFTVRRSNKFWSGLWTDLTIEQVLMRAMKAQGGLSHGRGISSSVLARWTGGMVYMLNICQGLEYFWDVSSTTSEQHVDMRPSRRERDTSDLKTLNTWFDIHLPFPQTDKLLSISSGIVGGPEVDCHLARELGVEGVKNISGQQFGKVSFKRKDKVKTLATVTIKLHERQIAIDPLTIFQRLCITKQSEADLERHFHFELAPYPMSLFCENGMRKGTKSSLYTAFMPLPENVTIGANTFVVVDGGYLLHRVVWHQNDSIRAILASYVSYTFNNYKKQVAVVFDGYPDDGAASSTKTAERLRRYNLSSCSDIIFGESTLIAVPQDKFLSNDKNKQHLIRLLRTAMERDGIETKQAKEDADSLIVRTAIEKSITYDNVLVIGEDVDLLVLLNGLGSTTKNVVFQKSGRGESGCLQFSSTSLKTRNLSFPPPYILFFHAFTGCDTTSALYWQGKTKVLSTLEANPHLLQEVNIFLQPNSSKEDVAAAGSKCLAAMYGGDTSDSLSSLRYKLFVRSAASAKVHLARLPPTEDAAAQHSFRTYHQVQQWLGNEKDPTEWGWTKSQQGLLPITTRKDPAPQQLLKFLSCKCAKGCAGGGCTCKKAGLKCSALCKTCRGRTCSNSPPIGITEDSEDDEEAEVVPFQEELFNTTTPHINNPEPEDIEAIGDPGPSKRLRK